MHHILQGIVKSDSPEEVKRNLIENKLIPAASKPMNLNDCQSLLEASWDLAISGDTGFLQNGGIQVFTAWCKHHRNALMRFFTQSHLTTALTSPEVIHKDKMLQLVAAVLSNMEDDQVFPKMCCVVQAHCVAYLDGCRGALPVTCAMVSLLERFPQCVPKKDQLGKLCSVLTYCVVAAPCPTQAQDLKPYIKDINSVALFIKSLWTLSEAALHKTLDVVSAILTSSEDRFSPPLASVVELLPPSLVSTATSSMSHSLSGSVDVEPLVRASRRLLQCLAWPGMNSMHLWVTAALRGFVATGRFAAIADLFESSVDMVFCRAIQPLTRKCAFPVLTLMLLSYQHSPALFHKILPHLPLLVKELWRQKNGDMLQELASLSYTMMYLHSGFPDLYDPVLDALKDVSAAAPSVDEMQQLLSQYRVASAGEHYIGGIVGEATALVRREAELVGLLNLGNTCYANSVLQALYMTSRLRNQLLQSNTVPPGTISKSLQELFAFLALSQRPAVCPEDFLRTSKPPWFQQGEQQDCSEFLRYLVDSSHEEQKNHGFQLSGSNTTGQTLIQEVFGGVVCTTYCCLTCNGESKNEEAITDLHVAFPEGSVTRTVGGTESKAYHTRSTAKSGTAEAKNESSEDTSKPLTLEDMLETYFEPESMEGENRYHCSVCGTLRDARRTVALAEPPRHLVLTLMRFSYDGATRTRAKILREVAFPQTLVLPSNCGLGSDQQATYILYAVVVHSGTSADRGHYYTYARYSSQESLSPRKSAYRSGTPDPLCKRWYLFNDSRVSAASYASLQGLTSRFPRDTAYVLFYRQMDSDLAYQEAAPGDLLHPSLRDMVDLDNVKYFEEQEAKSKRARWSFKTHNGSDSFDGGPSPSTGGCGGGMGGGLGDMPHMVF
ncbi:ubiquitin carboxyl-terminal hydrolase 38 [Dermacentor andersoni]|uniref:ubiquitin carboxyl-terminal hydrolase 38 n=1 Tax=Dermacentor andersoni TaxID=34620 RepID=UPI002155D9A9|nr:ubiquitin carboxyl-terminal hydrolase 35-like [Dermacentor andersoni]